VGFDGAQGRWHGPPGRDEHAELVDEELGVEPRRALIAAASRVPGDDVLAQVRQRVIGRERPTQKAPQAGEGSVSPKCAAPKCVGVGMGDGERDRLAANVVRNDVNAPEHERIARRSGVHDVVTPRQEREVSSGESIVHRAEPQKPVSGYAPDEHAALNLAE
jgi:hypothetical protein